MTDSEGVAAQPQPTPIPTKVLTRVYQDPLETWSTKFARKFSENPLVPVGCLLTCGALVMSAYKLRQGKSKEMNHWLRARVALQGVTVVALLVGSMQLQKAGRESEAVRLRDSGGEAREKLEFEKRLLEAERVTEEEERFRRVRVASSPVVEVRNKSSWWWPWSKRKGSDDKT